MPTRPEAATAATSEAARWAGLATEWTPERHAALWEDLPPTEHAVVRYYRPDQDLERRARHWGYAFGAADLGDLCRFGASLALAEAEAWERNEASVATRALADRRFLLGDRLLHWAVPWLDAAGRCHGSERGPADRSRQTLLDLGDLHRPAPALTTGTEGLFPPGEDSYGPLDPPAALGDHLLSVWSGRVVMAATIDSLSGGSREDRSIPPEWVTDLDVRPLVAAMFRVAGPRWRRMAREHPGSSRIWLDLANRADRTADQLDSWTA